MLEEGRRGGIQTEHEGHKIHGFHRSLCRNITEVKVFEF